MPSVAYIDGDNVKRYRKTVSGDGTPGNPDVVEDGTPALEALVTALSAKIPALLNSRIPVDAPAAVPVYSPATPPTLAITAGQAITASTGVFFNTAGMRVFRIQVNNTGASALNGFEVSTRCHASADMQVHLNTATDYTAPPAGSILRHSGDTLGANISPTTLAATNGKIILTFDLTNFFAESLRIRASATAATTLQFLHGGV